MENNNENYIPFELLQEAGDFIKKIDEDVMLYKIYKKSPFAKQCIEADKFGAYWDLASYNKYPHSLITLYEHYDEINNSFDIKYENAIECLIHKIKLYYLLLKENNLIGE